MSDHEKSREQTYLARNELEAAYTAISDKYGPPAYAALLLFTAESLRGVNEDVADSLTLLAAISTHVHAEAGAPSAAQLGIIQQIERMTTEEEK